MSRRQRQPKPVEPEPEDDGEGEGQAGGEGEAGEGGSGAEVPENWEKLLNGSLDLCRLLGAGAAAARAAAQRNRRRGGGGGGGPRGVGRRRGGGGGGGGSDDDGEDGEDDGEDAEDDGSLEQDVDDCQGAAEECLSDFSVDSKLSFLANVRDVLDQHLELPQQQERKQKTVLKTALAMFTQLIKIVKSSVDDAKADTNETAGLFELVEVFVSSLGKMEVRSFDKSIVEYISIVNKASDTERDIKIREHAVLSMCAVTQTHADVILKFKALDKFLDLVVKLTSDPKDTSLSTAGVCSQNLGTTLLDTLCSVVQEAIKPQAAICRVIVRCVTAACFHVVEWSANLSVCVLVLDRSSDVTNC